MEARDKKGFRYIALAFTFTFSLYNAAYADNETSCRVTRCSVGQTVMTYSMQSDQAVGCPTMALARYTSYYLGMLSFGTNEKLLQGEAKSKLQSFRDSAGVDSFEEAMQGCWKVAHRMRVTIVQHPEDLLVAKVAPVSGRPAFWMSYSHLDAIGK